ncbi:MAG TPA: hypothetical protein VNP98_13160 [Chthoniobacterales bacterium]|nr:hypothetical protein [Chthoniobacterales bacterium]
MATAFADTFNLVALLMLEFTAVAIPFSAQADEADSQTLGATKIGARRGERRYIAETS